MIKDVGLNLEDLIEDKPEEELFRYHRSALTSPEILEIERRKIFDKSWLYLGHESEVPNPGDYKRRNIAGRPIFFIRGRQSGEVNVLYNTCIHRGAVVCRHDEGNAKALQCFYHAWTYDTEGNLIGLPDEKAYGGFWSKEKMGLKPVRAENYRGLIFVNFDPDAEDLVTYLAGAREYIDIVIDTAEEAVRYYEGSSDSENSSDSLGMEVLRGTHLYGVKANWKLLAENSYDAYHVAPTHESYMRYLKDMGHEPEAPSEGTQKDLGNGHAVMQAVLPWGRTISKWSPMFGEDAKEDMDALRDHIINKFGEERGRLMTDFDRNLVIFPNLVINDIMSLVFRTFYPTRPDYMEATQWEFVPKGERPDLRAKRLDAFLTFLGPGGFATPEDTEAMESCQQGFRADLVEWSYLSRGFQHDPPSPIDEHQLRTWWREWHRRMLAEE